MAEAALRDESRETVFPPLREEIVNSLTHGLGLLAAIAGCLWLFHISSEVGGVWHIAGCAVYGISLVVLYAASTLYHSFQHRPTKELFRLVDHVCIYLLIAGTYTPFAVVEGGAWGWTIFTLVWLFSAWGITVKILGAGRLDSMSYLPYIATGWLAVIAAKPIIETLPISVLLAILAGGLSYTAGVFFLIKDRAYFHSIWHLFVLAGSAFHYYAVIDYITWRAI